MAKKGTIRSIRISDEMAALIDQQAGSNFTEKWENLVTRCVWEVERQEERLKDVKMRIAQEQKRLYDLQRATEELRMMERDIQSAKHYFAVVERRAKAIAEAAERNE